VHSANFSLYTTLDEPRARELLENLELLRGRDPHRHAGPQRASHVPTEIYAFESENDYRPFQPFASASGFFRPTLRINFVALSAGLDAEAARCDPLSRVHPLRDPERRLQALPALVRGRLRGALELAP
jgi:hypothetical protein